MSNAALNVHYSSPSTHAPFPRTAIAPVDILLVEDEDSDVMLTEISLLSARVKYNLHRLSSGRDVIPYLFSAGKYQNAKKPAILMLDLSLPDKDGFEILAELAAMPERIKKLPIIILTADSHSMFLKHSYNLNIVAYLSKPCTAEKMRAAVQRACAAYKPVEITTNQKKPKPL